jgi:hypothetical protein
VLEVEKKRWRDGFRGKKKEASFDTLQIYDIT